MKPLAGWITPLIQRQVEEGEEVEPLMTKSISSRTQQISDDLHSRLSQSKGGGQLLPETDRSFMERRFGADFSAIKVHTNSNATQMNRELSAQAFTHGRDIYFGPGRYSPTSSGKRLLARELTHVVQQTHRLDATDSPTASIRQSKGGYTSPLECRNPRSNCLTSNDQNDCLPISCAVGDSGTCGRGGIGPKCCCYGLSTTERSTSTCTPAVGTLPTNCSAYIRNSWWLPMAYVNNATCACQETPSSPTANCVRKSLQDRMAATPGWLQVLAAGEKVNDNPANPQLYAAYQAFVQTFLTPRIYRDHVDAYRNCCCPSGPAAYPAWIGVTTVPMPCSAVGWSIRQFGSCHGTPGRW